MSLFKLTLGVASNVAIFGLSLFLPADTIDWWRAWVFLGVVLVGAVASTAALYPHLVDQLVPYLAMCCGESTFTTSCITRHLLTNLWVTALFLPFSHQLEGGEGQAGRVTISPHNRTLLLPGRPGVAQPVRDGS